MAENKPIPKSQEQLSQESLGFTGVPVSAGVNRALQVSRADDTFETLTVGIKDIDESIHYYFNNVLQPSVTQNGKKIKVISYPKTWKPTI